MSDRAANALLAAGACVVGLAGLYVAAFHVAVTANADVRVFDGFLSLRMLATGARAAFFTELFDMRQFAVASAIVLAAAAWLGRFRLAAVGAILLGANVTTQLLKMLTAAPRNPAWLSEASWPSGHVTAAASLALCVVLIAPAVLRPWAVGAGALGVLATTYSIFLIGSHHLSDVFGAMLVAGAWTGVAVAALDVAERRRPSARRFTDGAAHRRRLWLAPVAAAIAVAALLVTVASVEPLRPYLADHTTFLAGAVGLAACGAVLLAVAATLLDPETG